MEIKITPETGLVCIYGHTSCFGPEVAIELTREDIIQLYEFMLLNKDKIASGEEF